MVKRAVNQDRSKRRGEAHMGLYGEPLSGARTPLVELFRILPEMCNDRRVIAH
jgi:hypothetical protein